MANKRLSRRLRCEVFLWLFLGLLCVVIVQVNLSIVGSSRLDLLERGDSISIYNVLSVDASPSTSKEEWHVDKQVSEAQRGGPSPIHSGPHSDHFRHSPPDPDKQPVLQILKLANASISASLQERLPSWQDVVEKLGDKPIFIGLETCHAFNQQVPKQKRYLAGAGAFNSGTNLLFDLLFLNCRISAKPGGRRSGIEWQVNWGKHQSPRFRFQHVVEPKNTTHFFPVVMVRDPWTWMQSMCRQRYSAHWYHVVPHHCPNMIPNHVEREWFDKTKPFVSQYYHKDPWKVDNVLDKANFTLDSQVVPVRVRYKSANIYHTSLAHMWKDWYQEYYDANFPRLMIRLEDLVFHPVQVLKTVCQCVGGTFAEKVTLEESSAKKTGANIHGKNRTSLADAMILHICSNRTMGMTTDDVTYAKQVFADSVMNKFGYRSPA